MADWVALSTVPSLQALFEALASNDMEDDDEEEEDEGVATSRARCTFVLRTTCC